MLILGLPLPVPRLPLSHLRGNQARRAEPCERLEQSIQGRKHGFLAGNLAYYIGGFHASWTPVKMKPLA